MRILHIVHDFLPRHVAGVEVYTDHVVQGLSAEHDVAILYSEVVGDAENYSLRRGRYGEASTFEIVNNHCLGSFEETYRNPAVERRVEEVLDEFRPDVVHIQHLINLSTGLVDAIHRRGIPMVMTLHDHWLTCANGGQRFDARRRRCDELVAGRCGACTVHMNGSAPVGRITRRMGALGTRLATTLQARRVRKRWDAMRALGSKIDLFLAPSRYLGDELVRFGLPRDRVHHSDYGFPTERFRRREDLPEVARRFAFIGSVMPHKGVHVLLEAFQNLPEDARLEVCGFLDYAPDYTTAITKELRHPGVRFAGGLPPDRVAEFLQGVDCLIVPSIWNENSPLTIHEAHMSGVPVVASRMGGQVELIEPGGGLLYAPDDSKELAEQLMRLYSEPGLARQLAASAPPVKSLRDHVPELEGIYARLCADRARAEKGRGSARL